MIQIRENYYVKATSNNGTLCELEMNMVYNKTNTLHLPPQMVQCGKIVILNKGRESCVFKVH